MSVYVRAYKHALRAGEEAGRLPNASVLSPRSLSLSPTGLTYREKGPNLPAREETGKSLVEH